MLNNIRKFSKTWLAKILLLIIIVPFVFWGMGGVFSGGNSNNIAKINNKSISTQDFVDYVNQSNLSSEYIKNNIDNNVLENVLAELISKNMLKLEINDLEIKISDKILNKKIKKNKNFIDDKNKFSRTKYEKFLLSTNITAPIFELKLREAELRDNLFAYISGGIKSPLFATNDMYNSQNKKVNIDYINLNGVYKKKNDFTEKEITDYLEENKENLNEKKISFDFAKINPKNLIGVDEYNNDFFNTIDDIENSISDNISYNEIINKFNLKSETKLNFNINDSSKELNKNYTFIKDIVNKEEINTTGLIDKNEYYILYNIQNITESTPSIENLSFKNKLKDRLYKKTKFEFNRNLFQKINEKKFNLSDFKELSVKNNLIIKNLQISSIDDDKIFSSESTKYLYSLKKDNLTLVNDTSGNIYLVTIKEVMKKNITKSSEKFNDYEKQSKNKIRDQLYVSYDLFLNNKYKVKINQKTLDRVKNYFR